MTVPFYVKTVPFSLWWTKPLVVTANVDAYQEEIPFRTIGRAFRMNPTLNVTTVEAGIAVSVLAALSAESAILDLDRRARAKRQDILMIQTQVGSDSLPIAGAIEV